MMPRLSALSIEERIKIIELKFKYNSPVTIKRKWKKEMNSDPPSRPTINAIFNKFIKTGSVLDAPKPGRPLSKSVQFLDEQIKETFKEKPNTSLRRISNECDTSYETVRKAVKKLHFRPYIPRLVQSLTEDDFDRRMEFCEEFLALIQKQTNLPNLIIWSDEAKFHVDGCVNRHNSVYWCEENPQLTIERCVNSPGVMVWACVYASGFIGPYFFTENVTGTNYLNMLNDYFWPAFNQLPSHKSMFFMQDGAPAHWSLQVRKWLWQHFPEKWIGRRGFIDWPARSPDLTPMDFFFWGHIKELVYAHRIQSVKDLKQRIIEAFTKIPLDLIEKVCLSVPARLRICYESNGEHFENK